MIEGGVPELRERTANAYLVWPLAVLALSRELPETSAWERLHARQAFVFGIAAALAYVLLMAVPLVLALVIPGIGTTAVVWIYAVGLLADVAGAVVWLAAALHYRERTRRGELFTIPAVTPVADRIFGLGAQG